MNRKLYLGIMSFFAVVFIITFSFLPYYNPIYFYLQHISLFLFVAMLLYFLLQLGFNRLVKRIKKQSILRGYTITVLVLVLFGFSSLQLKFIETYQTSEFQSCAYYDDYGNAIYYTQLPNNCPDLEIISQTNNFLSFEVYEDIEGYVQNNKLEIVGEGNYDYMARVRTNIDITYDSEGNILESNMRKSTNILVYNNEEEMKVYNSITTNIVNEFIVIDEQVTGFRSTQTRGVFEDAFIDFDNVDTVEHYSDIAFNYDYTEYLSEKTIAENNDRTVEELYQVLISKNIYDNSDFNGDPIENNVLQILEFVCDTEECRVKREDIEVTRSEYVLLNEAGLIDFNLDHTFTISENQIDITFPITQPRENTKMSSTTSYSLFKDYGLVFDECTKTFTNMLKRPITRVTFKYAGNDYVEHGDIYSIIYKTDYGLKVVNKMATMEYEFTHNPPVSFVSSLYFIADVYYQADNIYDYGSRALYIPTDRDEIIYQRNPLVFQLLHYKE